MRIVLRLLMLASAFFFITCSKVQSEGTPEIKLDGLYQFYRDNVNGLPEPPGAAGPYTIYHYVNFKGNKGREYLRVDFFFSESDFFYKVKDSMVSFVQDGNGAVCNITGSNERCSVVLDGDVISLKCADDAVFVIRPIVDPALSSQLIGALEKDYSEIAAEVDVELNRQNAFLK